MTESPLPQLPEEPPASKKRGRLDLIVGLLMLMFAFWALCRGPVWPDRLGVLLGIDPPLILIVFRAWNRRFHPERIPVRWPDRSRLQARIETLDVSLTLMFIVSFSVIVYIDFTKHADSVHNSSMMVFCTFQFWSIFLTRYIEDRKYLPPPSEAKGGWSGTIKGLHSDHWGGRGIPKSNGSEA